jgi:hypothetical protein
VAGWFLYLPIGLLDGAMGAFPDSTVMSYCTTDSQSMRTDFAEGLEEFNDEDVEAGAENYYSAFQTIDELYIDCYTGYNQQIGDYDFTELWTNYGFLWNLLFNAGFFLVDTLYFFQLWG